MIYREIAARARALCDAMELHDKLIKDHPELHDECKAADAAVDGAHRELNEFIESRGMSVLPDTGGDHFCVFCKVTHELAR